MKIGFQIHLIPEAKCDRFTYKKKILANKLKSKYVVEILVAILNW